MGLVLERLLNESIIIGDNIEIEVASIDGHRVKLCINAPADIPVNRKEVFERIQKNATKPIIRKVTRKFGFKTVKPI